MKKLLKELNRPWVIFIITLSALTLGLIILVLIGFNQKLTIDTEDLVEEYAKFMGGIVSMLFGFYLVNVVWDRRMQAYQMGRFRKIMAHFYSKINALCRQMKQLLAKDFSIEENEESQQRDHRIQEIVQKLHSLGQGVETYAPEVEWIDDEAARDMIVTNWADIQTYLKRLPVGSEFRLDLDEFEETINALIESTGRAAALLRS